jgi:iron complex transport system permease protein
VAGAAATSPGGRGRRVAVSGRLAIAAALLALALSLAASVALGTTGIALERTVTAFTGYDGSREHVIVMTVRLPRAVLAAAIGAALGVAGAVMQALSRNPLAEPGLLGISWGAALAAVTAQVAFSVGSLALLASVALLGAAVAGLAVLVLGSLGRRGLTPSKLVVAGAALSTLLWSVLQGILVVDRQSLEGSRRWLAGSLVGRDLDVLVHVLPYLAAGLALAFALARPLTAFSLGEDVARGLGQRTGAVKAAAAAAVVLLAGAAVAVAGPLMLVGLAVPHLARRLVGRDYRQVLPATALLGGVLVVAADVAARFVIAPEELPVGVMTALVGAPVFVHIARRGVRPL